MALVTQGATQLIMAEDMTEGTVRYIEATLGIRHAGWRDRITVRMPDRDEAQFFGLPDDGRVAVFEIIRTGYDDQSKPFRVTVTSYPTDRNQFVMNYGTAPAAQRWDQPDKAESDPGRAPSAMRNGASSATDV
jgi:GntR family transcriptional regulator